MHAHVISHHIAMKAGHLSMQRLYFPLFRAFSLHDLHHVVAQVHQFAHPLKLGRAVFLAHLTHGTHLLLVEHTAHAPHASHHWTRHHPALPSHHHSWVHVFLTAHHHARTHTDLAVHHIALTLGALAHTLSENGAAGDTEACSQTNGKDHLVLNHDISSYHVAGRDIALSIKNGRRRS